MVMFIIQSAILLAIAFLLGCVLGALAHGWLGARRDSAAGPSAIPAPAPKLAAPESGPEPAPAHETVAPKALPEKDDLKKIRGIGREIEARLHNLGIHSYAQIAAWTARDRKEWGQRLAFPGRIEREDWVKQAKTLARGGATDFSKRVARGEVPSSRGSTRAKPGGRAKK